MALYKKGIDEVHKKMALVEKEIYHRLANTFKWSFKQVALFLFYRELKIIKSNSSENFDLIDLKLFLSVEKICKIIQITKSTLLKWIADSDLIEIHKQNDSIIKVDLISIHTFLQHNFQHYRKYSDSYLEREIDNIVF